MEDGGEREEEGARRRLTRGVTTGTASALRTMAPQGLTGEEDGGGGDKEAAVRWWGGGGQGQ